MKKRLKKVAKRLLKGILPKTAYCAWVDKKHMVTYRSTVTIGSNSGCRRVHINVCDNCKYVEYIPS